MSLEANDHKFSLNRPKFKAQKKNLCKCYAIVSIPIQGSNILMLSLVIGLNHAIKWCAYLKPGQIGLHPLAWTQVKLCYHS